MSHRFFLFVAVVGIFGLTPTWCQEANPYENDDYLDLPPHAQDENDAIIFNWRDKFNPMEMNFGQVHRGTFNMSSCSMDLFNCWEIVRPMEHICRFYPDFDLDNICSHIREGCRDWEDYYDGVAFAIMSGHCNKWEPITRRSSKPFDKSFAPLTVLMTDQRLESDPKQGLFSGST